MNITPRRVAIAAAVTVAVVALLMTRLWSSRNSFRQMRIFAPSARVRNFRTMDELFPANVVRRGSAPHVFAAGDAPVPKSFSFQGGSVSLDDFFDRTVTTTFLVLKDDSIVFERYFRDATPATPMTSWSVAKSVVSLLTGIARDEGKVKDLAAPLASYATTLTGTDYGKVSLRDALTMSSGIAFTELYGDPTSDIHTMFARIFYFRESIDHYLGTRSAEAAPGARFHYSSADTLALGLALRSAVQMPLATYLEEKLWRPLGMEHDATWNADTDGGTELAFCCLNLTARDYAKLGRLMARGGDWDGTRIVSEEWVRESTRPQVPRTSPESPWASYGYQWWIPGAPGAFMAAGVWGQYIYVDPARQVVIVKNSVDPDFAEHSGETTAAFDAIASAL